MNALASHAEKFSFGSVKPYPINGDYMEPTLRRHRDIALVAPGNTYEGEGIYAFYRIVGQVPDFYRVETDGRGFLRLTGDNELYWPKDGRAPGRRISREWFQKELIGKVRGVISLYDPADWRSLSDHFGMEWLG